MYARQLLRKFIFLSLVFVMIAVSGCIVHGAKKDKGETKDEHAINEATLQSHVMSFADRFYAIMASEFAEYVDQKPSKKNRYEVQKMVTYSASQAYIVASEEDPGVALLDVMSMVMLGRIIFQEEGLKRYGQKVQPIIRGFERAEKDIMQIAAGILTADQLKNVKNIVRRWRQNNPEVLFFPLVRFSDFSAGRRGSKLTRADDPDGIFESVEMATVQAEEMRLLAERGIYLATRLPQLWGLFGELWLSRLLDNPDVIKILADLSQLSDVSTQLATNLPDQITKERKAAIKQAMESISKERSKAIKQLVNEVSTERKAAINDFLAEEQRISGLLSDLRQTLEAGNQLIASANTLMADQANPAGQAKPFDIEDYQKTLVELSNSAQELTKLATTVERISSDIGVDELVPMVIKALEETESESEKLANYITRMLLVIIGVWFAAYVIAKLLIIYVSNKTKASSK
ncbi:MAG: hypothetical protein PVI00_15830 [Desulfobacterales bacterium]|jgi:hypothetical protein